MVWVGGRLGYFVWEQFVSKPNLPQKPITAPVYCDQKCVVAIFGCISTWSFENRVSKTFCNFSELPLSNSLFTVLFAYVVFSLLVLWLGICVEEDVDRLTILPSSPLIFCPYPQFSL